MHLHNRYFYNLNIMLDVRNSHPFFYMSTECQFASFFKILFLCLFLASAALGFWNHVYTSHCNSHPDYLLICNQSDTSGNLDLMSP